MNDFRVGSANPPTAPSWSAEEDADRLMDDVFSDIDSLLSGKQPTAKTETTPTEEYTSLQSLVVPQVNLDGIPVTEAPTPEVVTKRGWGYYTERLLFISSCASLVGVALWMAVNDRLRVPRFLVEPTAVTTVEPEVTATTTTEPIFADYVRRSLDAIDRQPQQTIPVNGVDQPPAGTTPVATTDQQSPAPTAQVTERIYIPVYPPNIAANAQQSPAPAPTPTTAESVPAPPPPPVASAPESPAPPSAPTPEPESTASTSALPTIPTLPEVQPVEPNLPAPPAPAREIYTLVGALEAGDRSAALFNIGGATQRFRVGEDIGASNWKLLSVQNQQILMGQGGQTRSLFVGQTFEVEQQ